MNNDQFRKILQDQSKSSSQNGASPAATKPSSLGSRRQGFIPMTPRNVKGGAGIDFAKQVAERTASNNPAKKIRSSGPKGAKLASGYTDRALSRLAADGDDEKETTKDEREERIKALEEQVKLGQLDQATFEKIRDEITGGDVGATHLVKGLDRRLLERVRRGEDVMGGGMAGTKQTQEVDDEFEALAEKDVGPVEREKKVKKGEMAPPSAVAGGKRSRDQILAELRAQRASAAAARVAARPELGDKFRSIDARSGPKIVKDSKGREVLITRDEHGNIKKKIRKVDPAAVSEALVEEKPKEFLDKDVFIPAPKALVPRPEPEEESDGDIFEGVGDAYNPLGDNSDDSDEDAPAEPPARSSVPSEEKPATEDPDADEGEIHEPAAPTTSTSTKPNPTTTAPASAPTDPAPSKPRNYFTTKLPSPSTEPAAPTNPMSDPTFLAAIQRAGSLANFKMQLSASEPADSASELRPGESEEQRTARLKRRAAMLATTDRDLEDMDMGFGSSRFEDAEDGEEGGKKGKLSTWKGVGVDDDEDEPEKKSRKPRERGRKRKGDKDSAADVLGVLERRKEKK
ncbi:hypothetical protein MBLNU457_2349t1 [Dothideomycetes sp. NU457]